MQSNSIQLQQAQHDVYSMSVPLLRQFFISTQACLRYQDSEGRNYIHYYTNWVTSAHSLWILFSMFMATLHYLYSTAILACVCICLSNSLHCLSKMLLIVLKSHIIQYIVLWMCLSKSQRVFFFVYFYNTLTSQWSFLFLLCFFWGKKIWCGSSEKTREHRTNQ